MQLLLKQLEDPAWNKSFAPYFESLPEWGTLYSKEIWHLDPDHLELLQEPYLVDTCHTQSDYAAKLRSTKSARHSHL